METQPRLDVLLASLTIEHGTSLFLAELLGIDADSSKTLGSKSSSLSFKNKVDLFTDIKALDAEDSKKLLCFAEIRNQFMHNLRVDTFSACFKNLDGKEKYLQKLYGIPDSNLDEEKVLRHYFDSLSRDLIGIMGKLLGKGLEKYYDLGIQHGSSLFGQMVIDAMDEMAGESPDVATIMREVIRRANIAFDSRPKGFLPPSLRRS